MMIMAGVDVNSKSNRVMLYGKAATKNGSVALFMHNPDVRCWGYVRISFGRHGVLDDVQNSHAVNFVEPEPERVEKSIECILLWMQGYLNRFGEGGKRMGRKCISLNLNIFYFSKASLHSPVEHVENSKCPFVHKVSQIMEYIIHRYHL